jgi:hypothetical protein
LIGGIIVAGVHEKEKEKGKRGEERKGWINGRRLVAAEKGVLLR